MIASAPSAVKKAPRRQVIRLMALWGQACPLRDASEARDGRLHYIAAVLGHPVASANDLTAAELAQVIRSLDNDLSSSAKSADNLLRFPNRSGISKRQLWKIRQIEVWLKWHTRPARLAGFLYAKFKTSRPEHLTHAQAWRAIEALTSLAARNRIKADCGAYYKVGREELATARDRLKTELQSWRPPEMAKAGGESVANSPTGTIAPRAGIQC